MMLNRAETPSASLFAISEEAEIRYTNGGVLYEVPAEEASLMSTMRSMSHMSAASQDLGMVDMAERCNPKPLLCIKLTAVC